jgi:hypothetical protein
MILPVQKAFQRAARNLAALSILLGLGGCMLRPVSEKELIGTYEAVLPDGTFGPKRGLPDGGSETLEIKPDGTCVQNIALKDGRRFLARGTWEYNASGTVTLSGLHLTVKDNVINPEIEKTTGFVQGPSVGRDLFGSLIIGSTEGMHYEKK